MFKKVLIANRGEIAVRIIRACRELGLQTVAVYSEADREALHTRLADERVCIGPPEARDSYLNLGAIMSAAEITKADAIHPGYGFLAEDPHFAEVCRDCRVTFVGPTPASTKVMGDKIAARQVAERAGVPVLPGSANPVTDHEEAERVAATIGYPLLIKAGHGGGGRGMRVVDDTTELQRALQTAQSEAAAAFGNGAVYLERLLTIPRHVEIQILADGEDQVVSLGERDCSIQRRYQKLIEESPCPVLTPETRSAMAQAAIKLATAIEYRGAGTVEFLLDGDGAFYFMEMNTRIQVEHPVTEFVTGIDLIKAQIRIAAGFPLEWSQEQIRLHGHAIECRVNAEDPETFLPSPGRISQLTLPGGPGVRVDTHVYNGYEIPPFYDSLVAKLIVHGTDRPEALARMRRALLEFAVDGIKTTIPFHTKVLRDPDFVHGRVSTRFIDRFTETGGRRTR